jgi:hypothetical protein
VVLSYALPYVAVLALYEHSRERYLLPLLPFLACLSTYGLHAMWRTIVGLPGLGRLAPWPAALLIALWVGFPALAAERLTHARAATNTLELAGDWLRQNTVPHVNRIGLGFNLQVPLYGDPAEIGKVRGLGILPWARYQQSVFHNNPPEPRYELYWMPPPRDQRFLADIARIPAEPLASQNADCLVTEAYASGTPVFDVLRDALSRTSNLVERVSPDRADVSSRLPIAYEADRVPGREHMSTRILRAQRAGPVIEIFCKEHMNTRPSRHHSSAR